MQKTWGYFFAVLIFGSVLAWIGATPPSPRGADTPAGEFSAARAMEDVRIIAAAPHPTGSAENAKVRAYLKQRLTTLGLEVSESGALLNARALAKLERWSGEARSEQAFVNIIGVLPGRDMSKPAVLLMAHHDTVWASPGAADDTIGIASIFEIVRAVKAQGPAERRLIVLLTDAEEIGLVGARHFFENNPLAGQVGAVINFEARGGGGTANMFQTSAENGQAAKLFAKSVKQPGTSSLSTFVYSVLPNDTDLTPALKKDYVAYNIANIGRAQYYHSPKIDAEALGENTLQHMGSQGLDLTRALVMVQEMPAPTPDATFFDVFGLFTLIYKAFWGWVFLGVAAVFYVLSMGAKTPDKAFLGGAVRMLVFLLGGGALLYGLNGLSGHNNGADYYDRLAAIPRLEVLALISCVAVFFITFGRSRLTSNGSVGAALPVFILGIAGQWFAPTASYFITLSLMLCGFAVFTISRWRRKMFSVGLILVFGYMLSLGHLLMLGVGPDMLSVAILPAAIATLALTPLYPGLSKLWANIGALGGLAVATVIALWIRLDPIAATVPLY